MDRIDIDPSRVAAVHGRVLDRGDHVVALINRVRSDLGAVFEVDVDPVDEPAYRAEVDAVFADGDRAVNIAGLVVVLERIHVTDDYPGFVVDELLGRELAGMIAGDQPYRLLAEATFHFADATHHPEDGRTAGADDLDAALAAGFQTRLPGWPWTERASPFGPKGRR